MGTTGQVRRWRLSVMLVVTVAALAACVLLTVIVNPAKAQIKGFPSERNSAGESANDSQSGVNSQLEPRLIDKDPEGNPYAAGELLYLKVTSSDGKPVVVDAFKAFPYQSGSTAASLSTAAADEGSMEQGGAKKTAKKK